MILYNERFWMENFYEVKIGNKSLGYLYINLILEILKEIYNPFGKWNKLYGERKGVIYTKYSLENVKMEDTERKFFLKFHEMRDTDWSLFNKADYY